MKNYYNILHLQTNATIADIKESYRRLAKLYHPDLNPTNKNADSIFKEIKEAYDVLSDKEARINYDLKLGFTKPSTFSYQHTTKESNQTNPPAQPLTPEEFLGKLVVLNKEISKYSQVNKRKLYDYICDLCTDPNLESINKFSSDKIRKEIVEEFLLCCKPLGYEIHPLNDYVYIELLNRTLNMLVGENVKLKNKVKRFFIGQKLKQNINDNKIIVVALAIILLIFVVAANQNLKQNQSSQEYYAESRPETGNLDLGNNEGRNSSALNSQHYLNEFDLEGMKSIKDNPIEKPEEIRYVEPTQVYEKLPESKKFADLELIEYKPITLPQTTNPDINMEGWDKVEIENGETPECFNFRPLYDYSIDNKIKVTVGNNTDVVIKLMTKNDDVCIRYVYLRAGTTYNIKNIPEGLYYIKTAYGKDWRQKVENGICTGKFMVNPQYKKGNEVLDFNITYESNYKNIPYYNLSLGVTNISGNNFSTNAINESEFNK